MVMADSSLASLLTPSKDYIDIISCIQAIVCYICYIFDCKMQLKLLQTAET